MESRAERLGQTMQREDWLMTSTTKRTIIIVAAVLLATIVLTTGSFLWNRYKDRQANEEYLRDRQVRIQEGQLYSKNLQLYNVNIAEYSESEGYIFVYGNIRNNGDRLVESAYLMCKLIDDEGTPFFENRDVPVLSLKPGYTDDFTFGLKNPPLAPNWSKRKYSVEIAEVILAK
jgi:hypothetical protein